MAPPLARSILVLVVGLVVAPEISAETFKTLTRPADGRTLAAEIADLNGDGKSDLVRFISRGFPPDEKRLIQVYFQGPNGEFPKSPSLERDLPQPTAAYDLADVRETLGQELLLLQPDGVEILSLTAADGPRWKIETGFGTTLGAATDERGLERMPLVFERDRGRAAWIGIPTFQEFLAFSSDGELRGRLATHGRMNFFVPHNSRLAFLESDVQVYFDSPHISISDTDGDGIRDIVASNRHQIRIYRGRPDGSFPSQSDFISNLSVLSKKDQIRGSGGVSIHVTDIDGDGLGDLLMTHLAGSFSDAKMETRIYLNSGTGWSLDSPDQIFRSESAVGIDRLVDLDGDGRLELVRGRISFGLLEFVETLLTRSVDATFDVHQLGKDRLYQTKPRVEQELEIPLSFDTFRPEGFLPVFGIDINGDGYGDLVRSGEGDQVEIHYGGPTWSFSATNLRYAVDTRGVLRIADWNGDGLMDLLLYNPRDPEATLRLVINHGGSDNVKKSEKSFRPRHQRR